MRRGRVILAKRGASLTCLLLPFCLSCDGFDGKGAPAAGIVFDAIDPTVDPCADFFTFACGRWESTLHPDGATDISRFGDMTALTEIALDRLVRDAADQVASSMSPTRRAALVGMLYGSCVGASDYTEPSELVGELRRIDTVSDSTRLAEEIGRLNAREVMLIFGTRMVRDPERGVDVLTFEPAGTSLSWRIFADGIFESVRVRYVEHIRRLAAATSVPLNPLRIYLFEFALAQLAAVAAQPERASPGRLDQLAPRFPWNVFLSASRWGFVSELSIASPEYFRGLNALLERTTLEDLKAYVKWRIIEHYAHTQDSGIFDEEILFHEGILSGKSVRSSREAFCFRQTITTLSRAVAYLWVEKNVSSSDRRSVEVLYEDIQRTFKVRLQEISWLDEATRRAAVEKLENVAALIGFPDQWEDYPGLVLDSMSYFRNWTVLGSYQRQRTIERITNQQSSQARDWAFSPAAVNAFYRRQFNEIVVPAGMFQLPAYNKSASLAVQLGTTGAVLGHELTHSVDSEGRRFDAQGLKRDSWTPQSVQTFEARSSCLVDQFSRYEGLPELHLDGERTLPENMADLGGLRIAHRVLERSDPNAADPPGYTANQQFFLAFSQMYCERSSEKKLRDQINNDVHSPARFRVNGTLTNMPEFARAFGCSAGAPMAQEPRCEVW